MDELMPFLILVGALAAVMGFFTWLASHARRRGVAGAALGAAMAAYDEALRTTAHQSYYEIRAQADRRAPMQSPDDPWRPSRGGANPPGAGGGRSLRPRPRRLRQDLRRRAARLWRGY
ncbi:hypothetical protein [Streptomyces sp. A5-4]|uniref:hypothetical protein n=1 Tax=Streptomyces sp. A5-4 TaxID=3384771 RepID=UPI003DA8216A